MPAARNAAEIITIRLLMNGESPMMSPVSGLRSGAPGGSVSAAITASTASTASPAQRRPLASSAGVDRLALLARELLLVGEAAVPGAEPRLDDARGDERDHDGEEERAADAEVEVRDEVDLARSGRRARPPRW